MTDLIRRALAVNQAFLTLGAEVFEAEGATFVRDRSRPSIRDSNHVARVTASTPDEIDSLLARVEREYAGFPHRRFDLDFTTPPAIAARLALEGYGPIDALVMLLEGELAGQPKPHEIRPVSDDVSWDDYSKLFDLNWREFDGREGLEEPEGPVVGRAMLGSHRAKSPPVRYWLAYFDGEPRAFFASWEGIDGVGQVEDLFTHPDYRHRGLATALIHHCVADSRSSGAGPVVIVCDPDDTPKRMYAAMGFRPVALKRNYWKHTDSP